MDHDKTMLGDLADVETVDTDTEDQDKAPVPETSDTSAETAVEETADTVETDKEPEVTPEAELLKKYGIDGEFQSVEAALAAIPHKNRQVEEQRRREREFMDKLMAQREAQIAADRPTREPSTLTPDAILEKFNTDPEAAIDEVIRRKGYVRRDELKPLEGQVQHLAQKTVIDERERIINTEMPELKDVADILISGAVPEPGQNKMFDAINDEYCKNRRVQQLVTSGQMDNMTAIELLYPLAKMRLTPPNSGGRPNAAVIPLTPGQKAVAKTSGGGVRKEGKKTLEDMGPAELDRLSLKETEKLLYEAGRLRRDDLLEYRPPD